MTVQRFGTSSAPCPNGIYVRHSDYAALEAEVRALRNLASSQVYELTGVVVDVQQGRGFDDTCLNTIKRVMVALAGAK
jgi:hypothetical protein